MATTTRYHIEMTHIDSAGNQNILYPKNTLEDVYTAQNGVNIVGKIMFRGECTTAAATAAKTLSITGFSLTAGAHVTIKFTTGITVANATLNISGTGAKPIYSKGAALAANVIGANDTVELVYNGTQFDLVGGAGGSYATPATTTKFSVLGTTNTAAGAVTTQYFDTGVYVSATAGQLVATSFSGNGAALTNLNASNVASGTLNADRLATSGVTANTYGPSANATLAASGSFTVPKVVVDAKGRITSAANITYKLPADSNTDTKVTTTVNTTTKYYLAGTTSATTTTGTLIYDTGVYVDTTAGRLVSNTSLTNTLYLASTSAYINKDNYTGKAATVGALTGLLVDSTASENAKSVTTKALTANQGYLLQSAINTLNSKAKSLTTEGKLPYSALTGTPTIPTSLKCPFVLTIQGNSTTIKTYDGSAAITCNITASSIGAAASSALGGLTFDKDSSGNWGYKIGGAGSVIPFSSGGVSKLWDALQYSGLVTKDMTFDQMCAALKEAYPKFIEVLANGEFAEGYGDGYGKGQDYYAWDHREYNDGIFKGVICHTGDTKVSFYIYTGNLPCERYKSCEVVWDYYYHGYGSGYGNLEISLDKSGTFQTIKSTNKAQDGEFHLTDATTSQFDISGHSSINIRLRISGSTTSSGEGAGAWMGIAFNSIKFIYE